MMKPTFVLIAGLALSACTASETACDGGDTRIVVANELRISRAENGVSSGFNLDGEVSTSGGGSGCGIEDYTGPNGEEGVDNAIARLIPALELTEAVAVEDLILQAINEGELLIMFRLSGLDEEPDNDSCVSLDVIRGVGVPLVGSDGYIVSGQTFDVDSSVTIASATNLAFEDNTLVAHGLDLEIPLTIFTGVLDAKLNDSSVRLEWMDDGNVHGYFGGYLDYWSIVDMAVNSNADQDLAAALPAMFQLSADLNPDSTGQCTEISFTFTLTGTSAFLFDD